MKNPIEVMQMASVNGVTISNDIKMVPEVKMVQRLYEQEDPSKVIAVLQKKKGKPQKKVTAFAIAKPGHIEKMVYAMLSPDVDLRELFRKVKELQEASK